ncbi:1912_t:CDS:10, partial [Paraglomus occultum]
IREIKGLRLLQVKNPWSHKRWTGDFSHQDNVHWTPELMRALNYDRRSAARSDDGVFWIDFDSVCKYFDSMHVNENPGLFEYKDVLHASWSNTNIVNTDTFNIGNNPQYSLEIVNNNTKASAVRLLLTKHIITVGENKDHIALHVYNDTDGKKIFYPKDPMIQGLYVNSPHILVRFDAQPGVSKYTVVVAQHEMSGLLYYTLRCFCQSPFTLCDVVDSYPIEKEVNGCWTQQTAGGHSSLITFLYNPQYKLSIKPSPESIRVRLSLEGPLSYAMNVKLVWSQGKRVASVANKDIVVQSGGEYRPAFCYCEKEDVQAGDYTIIVSTYDAGLCGDFKLTVASNSEFQISEIPSEGAGMFKKVINGQWIGGVSAMGHQGYRDYYRNPCYLLQIKQLTTVKIRLQARNITPIPAMNIKLFEARLPQHEDVVRIGKEVCSTGAYVEFVQGVCTDDVVLPPREEGYVIIFSTWERGVAGNFVAYVYSDGIISIEEISR